MLLQRPYPTLSDNVTLSLWPPTVAGLLMAWRNAAVLCIKRETPLRPMRTLPRLTTARVVNRDFPTGAAFGVRHCGQYASQRHVPLTQPSISLLHVLITPLSCAGCWRLFLPGGTPPAEAGLAVDVLALAGFAFGNLPATAPVRQNFGGRRPPPETAATAEIHWWATRTVPLKAEGVFLRFYADGKIKPNDPTGPGASRPWRTGAGNGS